MKDSKDSKDSLTIRTKPIQHVSFLPVLIIGALAMAIPRFFPEVGAIYSVAPWVYLVCFLFFLRKNHTRRGFLIFMIAYLLTMQVRYACIIGDQYLLVSIPIVFIASFLFLVPYFLYVLFQKQIHGFLLTFVFPVFEVCVELFMYTIRLGQQNNISLTQFGNKWLLQRAAIVGEYGITFIVCWSAAMIVYLMTAARYRVWNGKVVSRTRRLLPPAIALVVIAGIMIQGSSRYYSYRPTDNIVRMAAATGLNTDDENIPDLEENMASLESGAKRAAEGGAELLAFAEEAYFVSNLEVDKLVQCAQDCAAEYNMYILLPLEVWDEDGSEDGLERNEAFFIDKTGEVMTVYNKRHLVPFIETSYTVESTDPIPCVACDFSCGTFQVSFTICYDGDFSVFVRTMNPKTDLYIDPSWDWEAIHSMHYRQIGMRAVENGVTVFKPTRDGWTTVTLANGDLASKQLSEQSETDKVMFADVALQSRYTIYHWLGGFFNYIYIGAAVFLTLLMVILTIHSRRAAAGSDHGKKMSESEKRP